MSPGALLNPFEVYCASALNHYHRTSIVIITIYHSTRSRTRMRAMHFIRWDVLQSRRLDGAAYKRSYARTRTPRVHPVCGQREKSVNLPIHNVWCGRRHNALPSAAVTHLSCCARVRSQWKLLLFRFHHPVANFTRTLDTGWLV